MVKRKSSSFTLIELLVVMAVIVILMGILLPVVQKGRASAEQAQCANNYRQIGFGITSYVANNQMYYPGGVVNFIYPMEGKIMDESKHWSGGFQDAYAMSVSTERYIGSVSTRKSDNGPVATNNGVWACPSLFSEVQKDYKDRTGVMTRQGGPSDFSQYNQPFGYTGTHPKKETIFAMGPCAAIALLSEENYYTTLNEGLATYKDGTKLLPMHMDGYNALFADMHVKYSQVTDWTENGRNLIWDPSKQ